MWGISLPNLQMMLADSVAVLLNLEGRDGEGSVPQAAAPSKGGTHTTPPMNFGAFLKMMHEIQDHRK